MHRGLLALIILYFYNYLKTEKTDDWYKDVADKYALQIGLKGDESDEEKVYAAKTFMDSKSQQAATITDPNGELSKLGLVGPDGKLIQGLVTDQKDGKMSLRLSETEGTTVGGGLKAGENFSMEQDPAEMDYSEVQGILRKSTDGFVHDPTKTQYKSLRRLQAIQDIFNKFDPSNQTPNRFAAEVENRLNTIGEVNKTLSQRGTQEEMIKDNAKIKAGGAKVSHGIQASNNTNINVAGSKFSSTTTVGPGDPGGDDKTNRQFSFKGPSGDTGSIYVDTTGDYQKVSQITQPQPILDNRTREDGDKTLENLKNIVQNIKTKDFKGTKIVFENGANRIKGPKNEDWGMLVYTNLGNKKGEWKVIGEAGLPLTVLGEITGQSYEEANKQKK